VHGPNGFLRRFKGSATAPGAEVSARHDCGSGDVRLVLTNGGAKPVRLTVTDGYGTEHAATYRLAPGARTTHVAHTRRTHAWYDLAVTADGDPTFLRHLAGHVETGQPSTSDPALG